MFGFKGKKMHDITLHAPIKGRVVPLEEVPDPVFSQKIIGMDLPLYLQQVLYAAHVKDA